MQLTILIYFICNYKYNIELKLQNEFREVYINITLLQLHKYNNCLGQKKSILNHVHSSLAH